MPGRRSTRSATFARCREQLARLAERDRVEPVDRAPERAVLRGLGELPELRAVELVRLAELVEQPDDLVRMAHARTTGTSSRSTRSMRRPSPPSGRRAARAARASARFSPGYHLNGIVTRSASWPRARSSCVEPSAKISAPPRANGTCGRQTRILICARRSRSRAARRGSRQPPTLPASTDRPGRQRSAGSQKRVSTSRSRPAARAARASRARAAARGSRSAK